MFFPEPLRNSIQEEIKSLKANRLEIAVEELSRRYAGQEDRSRELVNSQEHRLAYLAARLPATLGVIYRVLIEIKDRLPSAAVSSLLDFGSGPGTVMWAAAEVFPDLKDISLIDKDLEFINLGRRLAKSAENPAILNADWQLCDLKSPAIQNNSDLVIASYALGEIPRDAIPSVVKKMWEAANQLLVVIEPGTPRGFEYIRTIRQELIALGAHIAAPCPHQNSCPMSGNDWCHFSQRINRTAEHKNAKRAALGYEDEKFSYLITSKIAPQPVENRIIRHPQKHSGHLNLTLCGKEGLKEIIVSRKSGDLYRKSKKAEWGDGFSCGSSSNV
jgi:ribosomal protein RSM22 (predicted rRNA methylase)